jgi:putative ABC transport system substrate-binding protein
MPTISPYREFVTAGGVMSYAGRVADQYRLVGVYTGRILRARDRPTGRCSGPPKWD